MYAYTFVTKVMSKVGALMAGVVGGTIGAEVRIPCNKFKNFINII